MSDDPQLPRPRLGSSSKHLTNGQRSKTVYSIKNKVPAWVVAAVAVLGLIGGAIIGSDADTITELESTVAASQTEATELKDALTFVEEDLSEMTGERDELEDQVTSLEKDVTSMTTERDQMADERDELLVRFDPQIQAMLGALQQKAVDAACGASMHAGYTGGKKPASAGYVDTAAAEVPDGLLSPAEAKARIDSAAVTKAVDGCFDEGKQRAEADRAAAERKAEADRVAAERKAAAERLYQPFSDGIFTVGAEISPGRSRSDGTGGSCYWKRAPDGRPDDITDNHLGPAGSTVILSAGEEFHSERCGTWHYLG